METERKNVTGKLCNYYQDKIFIFFGIDITEDNIDIHPTKMCSACFYKIKNGISSETGLVKDNYIQEREFVKLWNKHKSMGCDVCNQFQEQKKGGRPKKKKCGNVNFRKKNLPFNVQQKDVFGHLFPDYDTKNKIENAAVTNICDTQKPTFFCCLCKDILSLHSVTTKCQHYFCSICLSNMFKSVQNDHVKCGICYKNH